VRLVFLLKLSCSQATRNLQVVASEHSLGTISGEEEIRLVASILPNAAYDANTNERDIAIVKVWSIFIIDFLINKPEQPYLSSYSLINCNFFIS
jgi:hypothetical protein